MQNQSGLSLYLLLEDKSAVQIFSVLYCSISKIIEDPLGFG